ncbi:Protein DJ-1-like protein A, partial [Armadillidium vulgare]
LETVIAGIDGDDFLSLAKDIKIKPDMSLEEARKTGPFDVVYLPGGHKGAPNLKIELFKTLDSAFAPAYSLTKFGIYKGKNITCYPEDSVMKLIFERKTHTRVDKGVVEDGNLITAMSPAFTVGISFAVLRRLTGEEKSDELFKYMLFDKL